MAARREWLEYTRDGAPASAPESVLAAIRQWLEKNEIKEVDLEPLDGYYAIHFNGSPEPVPGVFLPRTLERDPDAVRDILEAAYAIYQKEIAAH